MKPRLVVDAGCALGEGPHWHAAEQALYWVDIELKRVHRWHPGAARHDIWALPVRPSALAETATGFAVATADGLARFDPRSGLLEPGPAIEPDRPGNRSNDGKVGPDGAFWVGTMAAGGEGTSGALYRITADGITRALDGIGIANTLAWAPDGRAFYLADSAKGVIWRMAFDPRDGRLGERAVFVEVTDGPEPDGSAMDVEGGLWNAQWDGARVVRYAADGRVDRVIDLPVSRPTSCAFGGPDRRTLYITSARQGLSEMELARQPAGAVFALDVGIAGCPVPALAKMPFGLGG